MASNSFTVKTPCQGDHANFPEKTSLKKLKRLSLLNEILKDPLLEDAAALLPISLSGRSCPLLRESLFREAQKLFFVNKILKDVAPFTVRVFQSFPKCSRTRLYLVFGDCRKWPSLLIRQ